MARKLRKQESAVSGHEIRQIVGALDDEIIFAILRTGATPEEVSRAFEWLVEDHYTKSVAQRWMDFRARSVYNILDYAYDGFIWPLSASCKRNKDR